MSATNEHYQRSKSALAAGELELEIPPYDGWPRYGISAVLRPDSATVLWLRDLGATAEAIAGAGHWVLGRDDLHTTLRSLEEYSTRSFDNDARFAAYTAAIDEAVAGLPAIDMDLRGLAAHPSGVLVYGHDDGSLSRLRQRFVAALDSRDIVHYENFVRDLWYISLLRFAAPVADVDGLISWCESRREQWFGIASYSAVDIVRWRHRCATLHAEVLHTAKLDG